MVLALEHQRAARAAGDDGNALRLPSEDALGVLLRVVVRLIDVARGDQGRAAADEGFVRDDLVAVLLHDVDEGAADLRLVVVDVAARIEDDLLFRRLLLHFGEDAVERIGREGGHIALACDADGGEDAERLADLHADVGACCAEGQGAHELRHALAVREHVVPLRVLVRAVVFAALQHVERCDAHARRTGDLAVLAVRAIVEAALDVILGELHAAVCGAREFRTGKGARRLRHGAVRDAAGAGDAVVGGVRRGFMQFKSFFHQIPLLSRLCRFVGRRQRHAVA